MANFSDMIEYVKWGLWEALLIALMIAFVALSVCFFILVVKEYPADDEENRKQANRKQD